MYRTRAKGEHFPLADVAGINDHQMVSHNIMLSSYLELERGQTKYCHGATSVITKYPRVFQLSTDLGQRCASHACRRRNGDVGGQILTTM